MDESLPPLDNVEGLFESLRHAYADSQVPPSSEHQSRLSEVSLGILDLDNMQEGSLSKFLGTSLSASLRDGTPPIEGLPPEYLYPTGKPKEPVSSGNSTLASSVREGEDESSLELTASVQDPLLSDSARGGRSPPASLQSEPQLPVSLPARGGPLHSSSLPLLTKDMGEVPVTRPRGYSLNHTAVPTRPQGDGEHSTEEEEGEEEEEDNVSVSTGDSSGSVTPSLDGSTPEEGEFDITPTLSEDGSDGSSHDTEERLGTEGQEGEPEMVGQRPVLEGDGEGSDSDGGGSSPSCGDGREGSEEPARRSGGAGDGVDDLSQLGQAPLVSVGTQDDTLTANDESGFLGSAEPPTMMEDALRWSLFEPSHLQSMMDRESMARSIRPPIMAGQEGVEGGQTVAPPQPTPTPATSAGKVSPHEDSPVALPSASTARSSFLSEGSLVHSGHQRPVALGEKEGEWGGPQPGVTKVASEGYFSAPEASHEAMTAPLASLGLDPALTRESRLEEDPNHSTSSSTPSASVTGEPPTVPLGLPVAQNVLEQLAQLHPSVGGEGRESSDTMSSISSEGSFHFEDTQQTRFNPFDSEMGSHLSGLEFDSRSLISASALQGQLDSEESVLRRFQQVEEMGSNRVSWTASFMSSEQPHGEGVGKGRDQSYSLQDQSVGAYFIRKSAKLEELELPPSPEQQVFEEGGSESDGTPSSFSESDAEGTLVEPKEDGGSSMVDHTLTSDTPTRTKDELTGEASVGSTDSIPITIGNGTTSLTFTIPELQIQAATDDEAGSQMDVDRGSQQGEVQGEKVASTQEDAVIDKQGDGGEKQELVDNQEEPISGAQEAVIDKQEVPISGAQEAVIDKQEVPISGAQHAAVDRPEEDAIAKPAGDIGEGEDSLTGSLSSSAHSSEAFQESLEEEPAAHTPKEGSLEEEEEEAATADVPPPSSLPPSALPVGTAQTSPTHAPLGSTHPTTTQAPPTASDSTVLVGDVSITTILGDLTLPRDPLLPPERTPAFAHFTPGLDLTAAGFTQYTRWERNKEYPQSSASRGSMGEYLKESASSSSVGVTTATPAVVSSASKPSVTGAPSSSTGGGTGLPSEPVQQTMRTTPLSANQHSTSLLGDTPLSTPSATPPSSTHGSAKGMASPPTSSAQLSAFLESLVAKYSPTRGTPASAPAFGDTSLTRQQERSVLPPEAPVSTVSPPQHTPSLSRSLQTEFSAASSRLSSSKVQDHTSVRSYGTSPSSSTGGGSPLMHSFVSGTGGGSPLRQYLGSGVEGKSPLRTYLGSGVGGGSPHRQSFGYGVGDQLSSFKAASEKTVSPRASHLDSSWSPSVLQASPSKSSKTSPVKLSSQPLVGVPKSLVFPRVCCVGTTLEEKLTVVSHSDRWTESKLTVAEVYHNGEKMSELTPAVFQVPRQCHLGPGKTDEIKVFFVPEVAGTYEAILSVQSSPLLASKSASKANTILKAKAEQAQIKVLSGDGKVLDFGTVQHSSTAALSLVLSNCGLSDVPLHLSVDTKTTGWHHFSLANIPEEIRRPSPLIASPSSSFILLPANQALVASLSPLRSPAHAMKFPGDRSPSKSQSFPLAVEFHAPKKVSIDLLPLGPPTEMRAKLLIKVDGSTRRSETLHEIGLHALVGVARLFAPRTMQSIDLSAVCGHSTSNNLPLRNAGNMALDVAFRLTPSSDNLTVTPNRIHLAPDTESSVMLVYTAPHHLTTSKHELIMHVEPNGPGYKVHISASSKKKAATASPAGSATHPFSTSGTSRPPVGGGVREVRGKEAGSKEGKEREVGELLCNSKLVHWGCVPERSSGEEKLVLRNSYPSAVQLKLSVPDSLNAFQLKSALGAGSSFLTAALEAGEERAVGLLFSPAEKKLHRCSLYIQDVTHQRRHKIPLCGIGGCAQVEVKDCRDSPHGMAVDCGRLSPDRKVAVKVKVTNSGQWAAFVRASCLSSEGGQPLPPTAVTITPSELVLHPQASEELLLICRFGVDKLASSPNSQGCSKLAKLSLVWGEELLRQRLEQANARDTTGDPSPNLLPYLASYMNQVEVAGDYFSDLGDLCDEADIFTRHLRMTEVSLVAQHEPSGPSPGTRQVAFGGLASGHGGTLVDAKKNLFSSVKGTSPGAQGRDQRSVEVQTTPAVAGRGVAVGGATTRSPSLYLPTQTILFPLTKVGKFADHSFELHNPDSSPMRWFMSSVGPPLVRGTERSESDVFKATYAVFWLQELNGVVNARDRVQVPVTFHPRDPGMYTQTWDVNLHLSSSSSRKIRLTFTAQASPPDPVMEVELQPVHSHVTGVVYIDREKVKFPTTAVGTEEVKKVRVVNKDSIPHSFTVIKPSPPFSIAHPTFALKPRQFARLPVYFAPTEPAVAYRSILAMKTESGHQLFARLSGKSS